MAYIGSNEQLRNALWHISERVSTGATDQIVCAEAADRIEALEARVAAADKLAEALSNAAADLDDYSPLTGNTIETVSAATARKALAAYQATKEGK